MLRRNFYTDMAIKNKKEILQTPKGTRDILPHDFLYWKAVENKAEEIARAYAFKPIRTPHFEKIELFTESLGATSDVVERQMYGFKTRGGDALVLRPEGTVPAMRAYYEHGMHTWPQPVMLHYTGSFSATKIPSAAGTASSGSSDSKSSVRNRERRMRISSGRSR